MEYADEHFPDCFPDVGGSEWPFTRVYLERPKFVEFALIWKEASGSYGKFKKYCHWRKTNNVTPKNP